MGGADRLARPTPRPRIDCWLKDQRQKPSRPQLPEQQARLSLQRSLRGTQRHLPDRQRREQQSALFWQKSPRSPQSQRPPRQTPEQQPRSRWQRAPLPAQTHLPRRRRRRRLFWPRLRHLLEQHCRLRRHWRPLTRQFASISTSSSWAMPSCALPRARSAARPPAKPPTAVRRLTIRAQLSKRQSSIDSPLAISW